MQDFRNGVDQQSLPRHAAAMTPGLNRPQGPGLHPGISHGRKTALYAVCSRSREPCASAVAARPFPGPFLERMSGVPGSHLASHAVSQACAVEILKSNS